MANEARPYDAYKPSSLDWVGDVPEHWAIRRLKEAATIIAGQSPPSEIVSENVNSFPFLQGNARVWSNVPEGSIGL